MEILSDGVLKILYFLILNLSFDENYYNYNLAVYHIHTHTHTSRQETKAMQNLKLEIYKVFPSMYIHAERIVYLCVHTYEG